MGDTAILDTEYCTVSVRIRLKRVGRRNRPSYRVGVFDNRTSRDGRCIETVGVYDPLCPDQAKQVVLKADRIAAWVAKGAKPTDTVASLIKRLSAPQEAPAATDAQPAEATQ